jgi:hypothetical protein
MRLIYFIFFIAVFAACNNRKSDKPDTKDTANKKTDTTSNKPAPPVNSDSMLLVLSETILTAIKDTNYTQLLTYIHPEKGIRLSPYGYIDTVENPVISATVLLDRLRSDKKQLWGSFDGTGDPISLSGRNYFKRFVYNVDFLHAPDKAVNRFLGSGNSTNNLVKIYPGCDFTEFHFSGFEKKYEGMDWASLRLVFKKENDKIWLVAIVHDEWTI